MKSKRVTSTWEFYRDNCEGFKEPMRKELRKLDVYVANIEAENAKLRDELDFCLKHVPDCDGCEAMLDCWECLLADSSQKERKRLDYENEKLRELVRDLYRDLAAILGDGLWMEPYESEMMELGVDFDG